MWKKGANDKFLKKENVLKKSKFQIILRHRFFLKSHIFAGPGYFIFFHLEILRKKVLKVWNKPDELNKLWSYEEIENSIYEFEAFFRCRNFNGPEKRRWENLYKAWVVLERIISKVDNSFFEQSDEIGLKKKRVLCPVTMKYVILMNKICNAFFTMESWFIIASQHQGVVLIWMKCSWIFWVNSKLKEIFALELEKFEFVIHLYSFPIGFIVATC